MYRVRLLAACVLCILAACRKNDLTEPDFAVSLPSATFNAGDTVNFQFSGNADFISFYPGTAGNSYEHRNRLVLDGAVELQFTSYKQYGSQPNSLQLMTTQALGAYTTAGISQATWIDITDRVSLSTGANNTASGVAVISDLVSADKPLYIAFRKIDAATGVPNTWTINNFKIDVRFKDNTVYPVVTLANAGWAAVDVLNAAYQWSVTSTSLKCTGGRTNPENEDWVISSPLYPLTVAPDAGIPIKGFADNQMDSYAYVFNTPGTYRVVFVGKNITEKGGRERVQELTVHIQ